MQLAGGTTNRPIATRRPNTHNKHTQGTRNDNNFWNKKNFEGQLFDQIAISSKPSANHRNNVVVPTATADIRLGSLLNVMMQNCQALKFH